VQFFSPNGPSFFLSMIHQVIWPSPGTIGGADFEIIPAKNILSAHHL